MNYANKKFRGDEFILFLDKLAFANLYTFLEIFYHRNMKKILFVLIALFSLNYCFSQEEEFPASESGILELTDNEQKAISDMFDFSLTLESVKEPLEAAKMVDVYYQTVNSEEYSKDISESVLICLNNVLLWQKYNFYYESDINHPEIESIIKNQYKVVKTWFKEHKKQPQTKWIYSTSGNVLSSCMQFLSMGTAMNEGLNVKKYYDIALKQDADFSYCLTNIAQWYFFAPAMGGGSKSKAKACFEKAIETAKSDYDLYFAKVFLSQCYFEEEDIDKCNELLSQAEQIVPNGRTIARFKLVNSVGHSYFDYTMNRKKIDKKIEKMGLSF